MGIYFLLLLNIPIAYYTARWHQAAPIAVMDYLRSEVIQDLSGTVHIVFLTDCHATPFYSHLHVPRNNVLLRFSDCSPPLNNEDMYQNRLKHLGSYNSALSSENYYEFDLSKKVAHSDLKGDSTYKFKQIVNNNDESLNISSSPFFPKYFILWDTQIHKMSLFFDNFRTRTKVFANHGLQR